MVVMNPFYSDIFYRFSRSPTTQCVSSLKQTGENDSEKKALTSAADQAGLQYVSPILLAVVCVFRLQPLSTSVPNVHHIITHKKRGETLL